MISCLNIPSVCFPGFLAECIYQSCYLWQFWIPGGHPVTQGKRISRMLILPVGVESPALPALCAGSPKCVSDGMML